MMIIRSVFLILLFSYLRISRSATINEVKKRAEELLRITSKAAEAQKQATKKRLSDILLKSELKSVVADGKSLHISQNTKDGEKSSKMVKTLDSFGISRSLHSEIIGMSSSSMPRESIIAHLQTHFPEKSIWEINDIVVAAHRAIGKNLPKTTDMKKENDVAIQRQKRIFSRAKEEFDRRKANV